VNDDNLQKHYDFWLSDQDSNPTPLSFKKETLRTNVLSTEEYPSEMLFGFEMLPVLHFRESGSFLSFTFEENINHIFLILWIARETR